MGEPPHGTQTVLSKGEEITSWDLKSPSEWQGSIPWEPDCPPQGMPVTATSSDPQAKAELR